MQSSFTIGEGWAAYRGPTAGDGPVHHHAAYQIAIGAAANVGFTDESGTPHRGPVLVVSPMTPHRIDASPGLTTFFVEPHCAFADGLRQRYGGGIHAAPELRGLRAEHIRPGRSSELDPRLVDALEILKRDTTAIPKVAVAVGLSPQRLRSLARRELGMPLARWRVWSRLWRAAEALRAGDSLAHAAASAGFSDQAHLARQMREMMGLTPSAVLGVVRAQSLQAT